ncbi:hypothetical protein C5167_051208 [Papaver somniferum]|nr:hypothetical protein C5167_041406 [Papaver somniferum]RZC90392.1 hypothetical protein C5167_007227 [Papaver somniferum]RZC94133.1 hypothetical protein C5167_051208 [Papaver somniferum]
MNKMHFFDFGFSAAAPFERPAPPG